jgi:hypothetical protein
MADRPPTAMATFSRVVLAVDLVAVIGAGIQLFVLSTRTDEYFAWTIKVPITAALLGAGYLSSIVSVVMAMRSRHWQHARGLLVMGVVITGFTTLATLLHLEQFHFDSGPTSARASAWAWLVIYIAVPVMLIAAIVMQEREGGRFEYSVDVPLRPWVRAALLLHAVPLTILGLGLAFLPDSFDGLWPWPLTPLTAGAVAAWLLTIASAGWWSLREGDWRRVRVAFPAVIIFDALALIGAARFSDALDFGDAQTWVYLGALVTSLGLMSLAAVRQEADLRERATPGSERTDPGLAVST